jgi:DNA primase
VKAIDTERVRHEHPIVEVVGAYGIELRRTGSAFVGRCPFHADRGRPNLNVYARSGRWICYRCNAHGDVIGFVQSMERLGFVAAVERLRGTRVGQPTAVPRRWSPRPSKPRLRAPGPDEQDVLAAAVELYANRLLTDPHALAYITQRGFDRNLLERYRVGFVAGNELKSYLRWRKLPTAPAVSIGLLTFKDHREFFCNRIVVPEFRDGRPVWLIGRRLEGSIEELAESPPKYLGLPGLKPLLGWEEATHDPARRVCVVEGPLDWLAARSWGVTALALSGIRVRPDVLMSLQRFDRVYIALDRDAGGDAAAAQMASVLGTKAARVLIPSGIKDVAELAQRPYGRELFLASLRAADASPRSDTG